MIVGMKCLDEEFSVKRCLSDFHDEPFVDKIIVIDGGSTDYTVQELKRFSKVQVFVHPWLDWYHNMECIQSDILLSYIPNGELMMILDFDEKFSPELKAKLNEINDDPSEIPDSCVVNFSRRTYQVLRYEDSPFAILGEDGWPIIGHQVECYPDYQARLIRKSPYMHWINSPHHSLSGANHSAFMDLDILHYEKDDARMRTRIEKKWARNQARRKELGLPADVFEAKIKLELSEYYEPETWK